MATQFFSENIQFELKRKRDLKNWIKQVMNSYGFTVGDVCIIFCADDYLLQINQSYLKHDYFTDVITFDYSNFPIIAGDIFISIDTVQQNAATYGASFEEELHRVIIHGVLHLCGKKDATAKDKQQMKLAEDKALAAL